MHAWQFDEYGKYDEVLRWAAAERTVGVLSIYGMQLSNLGRSDEEVIAFLVPCVAVRTGISIFG